MEVAEGDKLDEADGVNKAQVLGWSHRRQPATLQLTQLLSELMLLPLGHKQEFRTKLNPLSHVEQTLLALQLLHKVILQLKQLELKKVWVEVQAQVKLEVRVNVELQTRH